MIPNSAAIGLIALAALMAAPALADETPITTAPATAAPVAALAGAPVETNAAATPAAPRDISGQIADYLATSPAAVLPDDAADGVIAGEAPERRVHGVVSAAIGNHGYRSVYARSDIPVGKTGSLSIAVGETRGRGLYGYGYGYGYDPYGYAPYGYGHGPGRSFGLSYYSGDVIRERETRRCQYDEGADGARGEADCRTIYRGPRS